MTRKRRKPAMQNPVAKYAVRFQRAATFHDRTKYRRNSKHKGREPFPQSIASSR